MRRTIQIVAVVAASVLVLAGTAEGQEVPDLPQAPEVPVPVPDVPGTLPPPPDAPAPEAPAPVAPALDASAPLSDEACTVARTASGNAAKVPPLIGLALALVNGPAIEAIPSASAYFEATTGACATFPTPVQRSSCAPDREAAALLELVLGLPGLSATGAVFGLTGINVTLPEVGSVLDTGTALEEQAAAAGIPSTGPLTTTFYEGLECEDLLDTNFDAPSLPDDTDPAGVGAPTDTLDLDVPVPPAATPTGPAARGAAPTIGLTSPGAPGLDPAAPSAGAPVGNGGQQLAGPATQPASSDRSSPWRLALQGIALAVLLLSLALMATTEGGRGGLRRGA